MVTLLGVWPAVTNGQPFFYPDTTAYVRGADLGISKVLGSRFATDWAKDQRRIIKTPASADSRVDNAEQPPTGQRSDRRVVLAGRSIVYGVLLYLGEVFGGMWFAVAVQSLTATYLIFLLVTRTLALSFRCFLMTCVVLLIASTLPFVVSFLMPDLFAGLLILGFAILATGWNRLNRFELAATSGVLMFAVLAHSTCLILLLGLTTAAVGYVAARDRSRWIRVRGLVVVAVACVATAILWEGVFSFAVKRAFGSPPVRPPFITAKLVDLLGKSAVSRVCQSNDFVVCRFQDRLPIGLEAFLWSEDERTGIFSIADLPTKQLLEREQIRFAFAIIPPNLLQFAGGIINDSVRQLPTFGLTQYSYSPSKMAFFEDRVPSHEFGVIASSLAARSYCYVVFGRTVLYVSTAMGVILVTVLLCGGLSSRTSVDSDANSAKRTWRIATCILLSGIILNAIICGGLSSVNDRFQARVIWLVQLSAVTGVCVLRCRRESRLRSDGLSK